ncbi:hypothetical protein ADL25_08105 [Streptomyces sp. NRRL F-5122]|nr:hypothetical protein ADL25_08105 [Streptomyces sp. NRRL F-5122]
MWPCRPRTRREREGAERERLIVTAARELAEAEGRDALTTRRLAASPPRRRDRIQPARPLQPLAVDPPFATAGEPAPLRAAFGEPRPAVAPLAAEEDPGVVAETLRAGLHGPLTPMRGGRLPREQHDRRLPLLIDRR